MSPVQAPPLTVTRARVVRPPEICTVASWAAEVETSYAGEDRSEERRLAEFWFSQTGHDVAALCRGSSRVPPAAAGFRRARGETQLELASEALAALVSDPGCLLRRCQLALCSTSSVDASTIFQSLAGWVAGRAGLSRLPHFSVSSLQGASLAGATEILDTMLLEPGAGALFVAVERWALPFPRLWGEATVLGDGAVALWFVRGEDRGLRHLGSVQRSFDPFIVEAPDAPAPEGPDPDGDYRLRVVARARAAGEARSLTPHWEALLAAATSVVGDCLQRRGVGAADLDGWIPSALDGAIEETLRHRLGASAPLAAAPHPGDGYLCAAATPALLADVLDGIGAGPLEDGALLLSWGASLGGAVSAQLWSVAA
jgi:hypothetical protein